MVAKALAALPEDEDHIEDPKQAHQPAQAGFVQFAGTPVSLSTTRIFSRRLPTPCPLTPS